MKYEFFENIENYEDQLNDLYSLFEIEINYNTNGIEGSVGSTLCHNNDAIREALSIRSNLRFADLLYKNGFI